MKSNLIGLIDADFLKYLVIYDIEKMYKRGLDPEMDIPYNTVIQLLENRVQMVFSATQKHTKEYIFLFSGPTKKGIRYDIAMEKEYKGTRKYVDKVENAGSYRNIIEDYMAETYHYFYDEKLEADDLCTMAHAADTYIYSYDKDLRSSPGIHFDIKTKKFVNVAEEDGFKMLLIQSMTGDTVDNIPGIEGVGPVAANKIAANKSGIPLINAVIKAFVTKYGSWGGIDRFVEMYSLVNMRTNRGKWSQVKYKRFFDKLDKLRE